MEELHGRLSVFPHWGYVIYRTTYSAESNAFFPDIIRFIEACIKKQFASAGADRSRNYVSEDWPKYRSTIMEDPAQFQGASLDEIRTHFETWVDAQGMRDKWTKFRMCIILDEESLQTLKDATVVETERENFHEPLRYVKVLEAFPDIDQYDIFPGWMKCWTYALWSLWENMQDGDDMKMQHSSKRMTRGRMFISGESRVLISYFENDLCRRFHASEEHEGEMIRRNPVDNRKGSGEGILATPKPYCTLFRSFSDS
jgi:hypothetical protein